MQANFGCITPKVAGGCSKGYKEVNNILITWGNEVC
jgi:hypothetical protein